MAWFLNYYKCGRCATEWTDEWSCMCDDRCPNCDCSMSPLESDDLTEIIELENGRYVVYVSPVTAEDRPDYRIRGSFATHLEAQKFVQETLT